MKVRYLLLVCVYILCACNKENGSEVNSFADEKKIIKVDSIFADSEKPMGTIIGLKLWNDVLITKHYGDDFQYSFLDVKTGKLLARWGEIGEAPNEFIDFGMDFSVQDSLLVFSSAMKKELNYVSIPTILRGEGEVLVRKEPYPYTAGFRPLKIVPMGSVKIATGFFKEGLIGLLDNENNLLGTFSDYPFSCGVDGIYKGTVYQSLIDTNGNRKRLVLSILCSDIFEIYEEESGRLVRKYVSPFSHIPQIREKEGRYGIDDTQSIAGISAISVTDDLIYLGYSPLVYCEAQKKDYTFDEILSFDWNGNKVKKYMLPFSVSSFCADEDCIYGVHSKDDEMIIYRFIF